MDRILFREKTDLQDLVIFDNRIFGRVLALDGIVQTTEGDEFIYHEMLSHVPILAHGAASRVLIIGGGDGGMAREVLKHPSVSAVTMVEIDPSVIELCRTHLPSISAGAFDDPRLDLVIYDGAAFVEETNDRWDVIIIDSTDPVGPSTELFESEFYAQAFQRLSDDGIIVTQSESLHFHADFVRTVQQRMAENFPIVDCYSQAIATYAGNWWTFSIASKSLDVRNGARAPIEGLRYYDAEVHRSAFLPRRVLDQVRAGTFP